MTNLRVVDKRCGTRAGYEAHRRRGEKPCAQCRKANTDYSRRQRHKRERGEHTARASTSVVSDRMAYRSEKGGGGRRAVSNDHAEVDEQGDERFLWAGGKRLWRELHELYVLDPVTETLVLELCRAKDRLDRMDKALRSKDALWFELGEMQEVEPGTLQVRVVVNPMVGETRATMTAIAQLASKIGVLAPARQEEGEDPLAKIQAMMEAGFA